MSINTDITLIYEIPKRGISSWTPNNMEHQAFQMQRRQNYREFYQRETREMIEPNRVRVQIHTFKNVMRSEFAKCLL